MAPSAAPVIVALVLSLGRLPPVAADEPRKGSRERVGLAELTEHIERVVPALLEESGVPGAAVGIVHGGRVVYLSGFGWTDVARAARVEPTTLFNVGSISKTVAAWGVMSMVEDEVFGLDTEVGDLLPSTLR